MKRKFKRGDVVNTPYGKLSFYDYYTTWSHWCYLAKLDWNEPLETCITSEISLVDENNPQGIKVGDLFKDGEATMKLKSKTNTINFPYLADNESLWWDYRRVYRDLKDVIKFPKPQETQAEAKTPRG